MVIVNNFGKRPYWADAFAIIRRDERKIDPDSREVIYGVRNNRALHRWLARKGVLCTFWGSY